MTSDEPLPSPSAAAVRVRVQQRVTPFQSSCRVLADDGGAPGALVRGARRVQAA